MTWPLWCRGPLGEAGERALRLSVGESCGWAAGVLGYTEAATIKRVEQDQWIVVDDESDVPILERWREVEIAELVRQHAADQEPPPSGGVPA